MKVLVITEREEVKKQIEEVLAGTDAEVIGYGDPIKAMDNLDEVSPEGILIYTEDFPRHWKVFISFLRSTFPKKVACILITGSGFTEEEASKAEVLGVDAVLSEALTGEEERKTILSVLGAVPKGTVKTPLEKTVWVPAEEDRIELLFMHPETLTLIQGKILQLGPDTIWFDPRDREKTKDLTPPLILQACSFRIGSSLYTIDLELEENTGVLMFKCLNPPPEIRERF